MENIKIKELFDLTHTQAKKYLENYTYPWEVLEDISNIIIDIGNKLDKNEYENISENVWIHKKAKVFKTAYINGPCIIGKNTEIRHCAFIRKNALIGENCVVGNSTELKNIILFDNVQVPHYNYVGDSILGYKAHMGAGAITSNVKSDKTNIVIKYKDHKIETNMKKVGAMIADGVEVGCNSVLNPGTIICKNTNIYPLSNVRGVIPKNCIYKQNEIVKKLQ